jgi:lysophospholipase L1-like esterase
MKDLHGVRSSVGPDTWVPPTPHEDSGSFACSTPPTPRQCAVLQSRTVPRLPQRPLAALLALLLIGCAGNDAIESEETQADETVEIMPIGDSITAGSYYRIPLVRAVTEAACPVDFVGTFNGVGVAISEDDAELDLDHQAVGGWTSAQIMPQISGWMEENQPDIALVYLGTNDFYNGVERDMTLQNLESIIGDLRSGNPAMTILLAQIMPAVAVEDGVAALNAEVALLGERLSTSASRIEVVDMASGVDVDTDLVDGVHPNDQQSQEIADRWADALRDVIGGECPL